MDFLQNYGYEYDPERHDRFNEIKLQIESIIELCQEGEISIKETRSFIIGENIFSMQYKNDFLEKLDQLDLLDGLYPLDLDAGDKGYMSIKPINGEGRKYEIELEGWEWDKKHRDAKRTLYKEIINNMETIYNLTKKALELFEELLGNKDYQQKRKGKIKTLILQDITFLFNQNKKYTTNSNTEIDNDDAQQTNITTLPPVILGALKEGLLEQIPTNGKYTKRQGMKDKSVIKWMTDNSGYEDTLTADLYIQYIQTNLKPQTIGQYISASLSEAK